MKTNIILLALVALFSACTVQEYLPENNQIDVNEHGSYLYIYPKIGKAFGGELLAVDNSNIIFLDRKTKKCVTFPISEVKRFSLRYARAKNYGWTLPVYSLSTLTHGAFLIISMPINLITTAIVTGTGNNAYTYNEKDITYEQMKMFTRFPQGIPPGLNLVDIK